MVAKPARLANKILIVSTGAGSVTDEIRRKLETAFADHLIVAFDPKQDFRKLISPEARVVVAGGDGTIGFVARALVDSKHRFGILSLGTFNNFARSLGVPMDIDAAIEVAKGDVARPITVGRVNGTPFLEAAAIGLFGDAIALGEAAKDMTFGELGQKFRTVTGAKQFEYHTGGDFHAHGFALSLVFANTPSIGAQLPVGDVRPADPFLELTAHVGGSRTDIVGRVLASSLLGKHAETERGMTIKFTRLRVETKTRASVYADNAKVGSTPAEIVADRAALQVLLPASAPPPEKEKKVRPPRARAKPGS